MRCTECNKIIPVKRLRVLPHTRTCVGCSEEPYRDIETDAANCDDVAEEPVRAQSFSMRVCR